MKYDRYQFFSDIKKYDFSTFHADKCSLVKERFVDMAKFLSRYNPDMLNGWMYEYYENGKMMYSPLFSCKLQIQYLLWNLWNERPDKFLGAYFSRYYNKELLRSLETGHKMLLKDGFVAVEDKKYTTNTIRKYFNELCDINPANVGIVIYENPDKESYVLDGEVCLEICAEYKVNDGYDEELPFTFKAHIDGSFPKKWHQKLSGIRNAGHGIEMCGKEVNLSTYGCVLSETDAKTSSVYNHVARFLNFIR